MSKSETLTRRLAHLSPAQRALVEKRLRGGSSSNGNPQITRSSAEQKLIPLSFAQQRLWLMDQWMPGSPAYNVPTALRLKGRLDVDVLARTLTEIVRRHEVLRTSFSLAEGKPVQVIRPVEAFSLPLTDLTHLAGEEREAEVVRLAAEEGQTPFDLSQGPLLRAQLLRLTDDEHVALFTMHHIVSDGWSMGVLVREVAALYEAFSRGEDSPLAELPIQYADYAIWQRQRLQGEVLEQQLSYWRGQLGGELPVVELPTDRPRPAVQTFAGQTYTATMEADVADSLRELSKREGVTLYMTMLAAFQLLISRYTGLEDVPVGTAVANRTRGETEGLIGFFVNTLVMRGDLSGDPTFRELLGRVRETSLEAYAHQEVPFERLVEELQPERSTSHTPLFQVVFGMQNAPREALEAPGLQISRVETVIETAKCDLVLNVTETGDSLLGSWTYNTDLFDRSTVERLASHFANLLRAAAADPEAPAARLPLLSDAERERAVTEWNETAAPARTDLCAHQLFEAQARETPDAVALAFGDEELSYKELNSRSNRLARHLVALGVGPGTLVALLMERSAELVAAALGVMKAGGAYVPLDPRHPLDRLAWTLEDTGTAVLLTQERLSGGTPSHWGHTIYLDAGWWDEEGAGLSGEDMECRAAPSDLAYVIYTSGSTGKPKGVMVEHRGLSNLAAAQQLLFGLSPSDRVLQFASPSFDASVWETFMALANGATLCLAPPAPPAGGRELADLLRSSGVTVATLPPSVLAALPEEGLTQLRAVISAGEACPPEVAARWSEGRDFYNAYGPTETTVCATARRCEGGERAVPIGRPIANTQVYVLDTHGQITPVGALGELYVGGAGVARGYLNRESLTAERFVADPFSAEPGARLYKTGDLARYLPTGELEYAGRSDNQVKLRGYRVELGEVEAAVSGHPCVQSCAVILRDDEGEKRLVAYVTGAEVYTEELREYAKEQLPEYMVPSAFVVLESLPLTTSGKLDQRMLPAPERGGTPVNLYVAPRTPVEEVLASIWTEVLHVERVGVEDSFFDLGGHSLLATQLVSRVRDVFGVEVELRRLFEQPTVAALASIIEYSLQAESGLQPTPVVPVGRDERLPLSFAQQRLWFIDKLTDGSPFYNISLPIRMNGQLDVTALEKALTEIVRRHEALRTAFPTVDGEPVQLITEAAPLTLDSIDLTHTPEGERQAEVVRLAAEEGQTPFDLSRGPLLRAQLLKLGEEEHVALLTMHHIVSDGWSMGVLVREVAALYEAFSRGEDSPLAELPIQYADYAVWQRQRLQGEVLDTQMNYWRGQLGGELPVVELPTDRPRPAVQTFAGASYNAFMDAELADSLRTLSRQEGVTLYMTMLTAFQLLLSRYTGLEDVPVGTAVANRTRGETEGLIGFFVNTLVMRGDLSGEPTFRELLRRTREVCLGAYAHQETPFERLVEELQPERSTSHAPLFQIGFQMQNTPAEELSLTGLSLSWVLTGSEVAKNDLMLTVNEGQDLLLGSWTYNTDLFDRSTVERLASHFANLLRAAAADPEAPAARLPLLSDAERERAVSGWNETAAPARTDLCAHQLFEAQARETPDALALAFAGEELSYKELNSRANQLAYQLEEFGAGPGSIVAVMAERSFQFVIGLLGVLKAGAAYLPLDPAYPAERLSFMLEDSGARLILTQERLTGLLPPDNKAHVLRLDSDWDVILQEGTDNLGCRATSTDLAYVIYTSGSTGKPKGVMVEHRGLSNLAAAQQLLFGLSPSDRVLQFASPSFDASVWETFMALANGATLCLAPPTPPAGGRELADLLRSSGVTIATLPPSVLAALPDEGLTQLRAVVSAGEACPPEVAARWSEGRDFYNAYGPTETTVCATARRCEGGERAVPIGRPIANTQVYVLDPYGQIAPVGALGELYVGGAGVARGYLNRESLTAERFVADPFSAEPGARLYKTGDLARYLPTGELEYVGRADNQVKLRGYRVELGEVEAAVSGHPAVQSCAVVVRGSAGHEQLVAYAVGRGGASVEWAELREHLRGLLPEYMVPSRVAWLDALPLTHNGKVDTKALQSRRDEARQRTTGYVRPRNELEQKLAAIWGEVLATDTVGVNDNFFDLGGHSLLVTKVHAQLEEQLGFNIPLLHLFEYTTISSLAEFLNNQAARQTSQPSAVETRGQTRSELLSQQREARRGRRAGAK